MTSESASPGAADRRGLFSPDSLGDSLKVYLSANAVFRALALIRGVLLTWLLSQVQFGAFQLGLLVSNVLLPLVGLGLYEGLTRYVPEYETRGQLWPFIRRVLPAGVMAGVTLALLGVPLAMWVGSLAGGAGPAAEREPLTAEVVLCVCSLLLYHCVAAILRGRRMFRALSLMELATAAVFTVASLLAALLGTRSGSHILDIYSTTNFLGAAVFGIPCVMGIGQDSDQRQPLPAWSGLSELMHYSVWAGLAAAAWQLLMLLPAWYLETRCGTQPFAIFSAVRVFTQVGYVIPAGITIAVGGTVTKLWSRGEHAAAVGELNLCTKATLVVMLAGCGLAASAAEPIMRLFPGVYAPGSAVVGVLLGFYLLTGAMGLVAMRFALLQRTGWIFAATATGGGVAGLFSVVWVHPAPDPLGPLSATGWSSLFGVAAALALMLILLHGVDALPDRGTLLLLGGAFFLPAAAWLRLGVVAALLAASICTPLIFSAGERRRMLHFIGMRSAATSG